MLAGEWARHRGGHIPRAEPHRVADRFGRRPTLLLSWLYALIVSFFHRPWLMTVGHHHGNVARFPGMGKLINRGIAHC
jgi:hypothetical protein